MTHDLALPKALAHKGELSCTCCTALLMMSMADEMSLTRLTNCSLKIKAAVLARSRGTWMVQQL